MYLLSTYASKKTSNVNKWNISFASQLQKGYWYFQRQNQKSLLIITSNLDDCAWGQNVPVSFTHHLANVRGGKIKTDKQA